VELPRCSRYNQAIATRKLPIAVTSTIEAAGVTYGDQNGTLATAANIGQYPAFGADAVVRPRRE
jgi:hypothetical protein